LNYDTTKKFPDKWLLLICINRIISVNAEPFKLSNPSNSFSHNAERGTLNAELFKLSNLSNPSNFCSHNAERRTRNTEPETILPFHHLSVTLFKLFLSYPLDIPPISHLYPISYKEVGYRWVIGKKREGKGMNTDKDIPER